MQKSTNSKQKDILHTQSNAEETPNENSSNELITRIQITGTPFTYIEDKQANKRFLTLGDYRITEDLTVYEGSINDYLENNQWTIIMQMMGIALEKVHKGEWQYLSNEKQIKMEL